ncbi:zinc-ribbon domain-containing protein [Candidatus Pelagibacter sp.]|nr:zinc-ribbon domain-containing protein [Candidatus Pelagibacter sp.]|tara:strand:- start:20 stop:541 length:522 start_codon:yes stop_codon:yes gene_type:complete
MIISCNNCNKRFELDASLIPEKGRLLQCNGCNNQWFFKKEIEKKPTEQIMINKSNEVIKPFDEVSENVKIESPENIELLNKQIKKDFVIEKVSIDKNVDDNLYINPKIDPSKDRKNYNLLGFTIIFIISFIALIVILDTFQVPISKIVPNIEFLLYNLYETINDIKLFLKDLI